MYLLSKAYYNHPLLVGENYMEYIVVLCSVLTLMYGDVNAMRVADQNNNENRTQFVEVGDRESYNKSLALELFDAVEKDDKEKVRILAREAGEKKDKSVRVEILFYAAKNNMSDVILSYKATGLPLDGYSTVDEKSALIIASENGSVDAVKCLLDNGAKFICIDNTGSTALSYALRSEHHEIVDILLEKYTKDDGTLSEGLLFSDQSELLFYAIKNSRADIVEFCVRNEFKCCESNKFNDCIKDRFEGTPQEFAEKCENKEILELLVDAQKIDEDQVSESSGELSILDLSIR